MMAQEEKTTLFADLSTEEAPDEDDNEVCVVVDESTALPSEGIEFDVPPQHIGSMTRSLLSCVRRLHINSGHPPNADLERVVRLAGGSEAARLRHQRS